MRNKMDSEMRRLQDFNRDLRGERVAAPVSPASGPSPGLTQSSSFAPFSSGQTWHGGGEKPPQLKECSLTERTRGGLSPRKDSHPKMASLCWKQRGWSLRTAGWQTRHKRPKWAARTWWRSCWLRVSKGLCVLGCTAGSRQPLRPRTTVSELISVARSGAGRQALAVLLAVLTTTGYGGPWGPGSSRRLWLSFSGTLGSRRRGAQ